MPICGEVGEQLDHCRVFLVVVSGRVAVMALSAGGAVGPTSHLLLLLVAILLWTETAASAIGVAAMCGGRKPHLIVIGFALLHFFRGAIFSRA
jgi:hypothetical protein